MRKVIELTGQLCEKENISDFRQYRFNLKQLKRCYRKAQKIKQSTSKNAAKKATRCEEVHQAYRNYLLAAQSLIEKSIWTITGLDDEVNHLTIELIAHYIKHAERQMDQKNEGVKYNIALYLPVFRGFRAKSYHQPVKLSFFK